MKRLIFILLVASLFSTCKKDDGPEIFDFNISEIERIEARVEETHTVRILVTGNEISPENVFLTLEDVPAGITCTLENASGVPEFAASLIIHVSRTVPGGMHIIKLIGSSGKKTKVFNIQLEVDKSLSAVFTVYNSLTYNPENINSNLVDSALVMLYNDHSSFMAGVPDHKTYTDSVGKARFFKLPVGTYLYVVEKNGLSNVIQKRSADGVMKGFIVAGLFRTNQEIINSAQPKAKIGDLKIRDLNADNRIDALDLGQYDVLSIYDGEVNEKVIWIGQ